MVVVVVRHEVALTHHRPTDRPTMLIDWSSCYKKKKNNLERTAL